MGCGADLAVAEPDAREQGRVRCKVRTERLYLRHGAEAAAARRRGRAGKTGRETSRAASHYSGCARIVRRKPVPEKKQGRQQAEPGRDRRTEEENRKCRADRAGRHSRLKR